MAEVCGRNGPRLSSGILQPIIAGNERDYLCGYEGEVKCMEEFSEQLFLWLILTAFVTSGVRRC